MSNSPLVLELNAFYRFWCWETSVGFLACILAALTDRRIGVRAHVANVIIQTRRAPDVLIKLCVSKAADRKARYNIHIGAREGLGKEEPAVGIAQRVQRNPKSEPLLQALYLFFGFSRPCILPVYKSYIAVDVFGFSYAAKTTHSCQMGRAQPTPR